MELSNLLATSLSLFILLDSIGNIPIFLSLLKDVPANRQKKIVLREMLIALFILVIFSLVGELFMAILQIKPYTLFVAGGIILFLVAIRMIFPNAEERAALPPHKEPFIVPLAIPLIAGPAALAAVILYSAKEPIAASLLAIFLAWLPSALILLASVHFKRALSPKGLIACERLMGFILTLIAIQMMFQGIDLYLGKALEY